MDREYSVSALYQLKNKYLGRRQRQGMGIATAEVQLPPSQATLYTGIVSKLYCADMTVCPSAADGHNREAVSTTATLCDANRRTSA
jgi:hypothetical protein